MKKLVLAAVAAAVFASPALAGTPGSTNNGVVTKATGQNALAYGDPFFGNVVCNETLHKKFDTVGCTLSTPLTPGPGTVGWISDFDHTTYGTLTYTVSDDGLSYSGTAAY